MARLDVEIVTLPAAWAPALINGDSSGLDDIDRRALLEWSAANPRLSIVSIVEDAEPRFTWSFRLYGGAYQGGEVLDYVGHSYVLAESRY